ncbi:Peroxiredoxin [Desulfonispora thiosulfatigenes DSM 11270]|uniref:Peroxiredoxin n=1 Tax=Desulfonispora thiosulfatigenes DSM 11270 TaxID=656914 RepID=A0A1W1VGJ8_DESTI|nr:TlpA disulfide reductase family protein [Desulfonispora thiosulfatigenes]SMB92478.1 Peroxiredoxin [Desulfonispora thiosulfatigenes DSM 11270]
MNKKIVIIIILTLVVLVSMIFILNYAGIGEKTTNKDLYPTIVEVDKTSSFLEEGSKAADFTWKNVDGNNIKLSDFEGKPVILNFWASWCSPCKSEMPDIEAYYNMNKEEVNILAINLTVSEKSVEEIARFLQANKYTFPVILDDKGLVAQKYFVRSIPTTYFIDANGVIKKIYTGPLTIEQMEAYIK